MPRKDKKKYTTIGLKKSTKKKLQGLKKYPRETDEDTLLDLIKRELNPSEVKTKEGDASLKEDVK